MILVFKDIVSSNKENLEKKKEAIHIFTLSNAIKNEIATIIEILDTLNEKITIIDISSENGRLNLIYFSTIITYIKKQLDSNEILPVFEPKKDFKWKEKDKFASKFQEIKNIFSVITKNIKHKLEELNDSLSTKRKIEDLYFYGSKVKNIKSTLYL